MALTYFQSGRERGIHTVLPTVAKIFKKLIYEQMYSYLVDNGLLSNQQLGFRSLHSTDLALNKSTKSWLMSIDKGKLNSVVVLDIKKAFDTVNRVILINKLNMYGISNNELSFLFHTFPNEHSVVVLTKAYLHKN